MLALLYQTYVNQDYRQFTKQSTEDSSAVWGKCYGVTRGTWRLACFSQIEDLEQLVTGSSSNKK